jgi:hypothetical protein
VLKTDRGFLVNPEERDTNPGDGRTASPREGLSPTVPNPVSPTSPLDPKTVDNVPSRKGSDLRILFTQHQSFPSIKLISSHTTVEFS